MNSTARLQAVKKKYWQIRSEFRDLRLRETLVLAASLRDFLARPTTLGQAEEEIKRLLEHRGETFLELVRTRVYETPTSPYLKLLRFAGCEFSDLVAQVRRDGVEGTLERLARAGVYITSDEFKGKTEVVRGGQSFRVSPEDFVNRGSSGGLSTQSSGTRDRPIRSLLSLDRVRSWSLGKCVFLAAHDLFPYTHAIYDAVLPAVGGIWEVLSHAKIGLPADRWFARKVPVGSASEGAGHYLAMYCVVLAGKVFGPGIPKPEFTDVTEADRIVRWVSGKRRAGESCCVKTVPSNAARIARVAYDMGVSLEGTRFIVSGESFTESKREGIERAGARATSQYGFVPGGIVGHGCAKARVLDEVHVNQHLLALIRHPRSITADGPAVDPLLFTAVHPSATTMLLNMENGDYATLRKRACGCALEKVGLTLHLHSIRSFEKFTSEGMNYFYGDLFELFEKVLPREFGGGPGDYQLVEEEDGTGQTRLTLVVHPEVGPVDEARVLSRLRGALAAGPWGNRLQSRLWQSAGTFMVVRRAPHAGSRGKILPIHFPH